MPGFAPGLPRSGDLRIYFFAGKLVETGLSGAFPRFLKPFRRDIVLQHLPGVLLRREATRTRLGSESR